MKSERINPEVYFVLLDIAGVKAVDIARQLGVSKAAVSRWRAGTRRMDDSHYATLEALATGSDTLFLATHRAASGQGTYTSPYGSVAHIIHQPDYQAKLVQSFQFQAQKLASLASADPQHWDIQALKAIAQDVHGMASALAVMGHSNLWNRKSV
jgi:hypothetical protein